MKNVEAAEAAGVPVAEFVDAKAARFAALREPLQLSYDDFIRTSVDPRHRIGVDRLWRACAAAGDLYERDYEGLYCTGCEAFVSAVDLVGGLCREHGRAPERVAERNWFFRLSRYQDALVDLLAESRLRIEPERRRSEVVSFVRSGLADFSVSRSKQRARGWGIPVPDDPTQVVYVWFDALANYVAALDYGGDGGLYRRWWRASDQRVHVIGKGIIRFHAVYWPAILLSAGEPLPTTILVHDYLTVDGKKLSKSLGAAADPAEFASRYGSDALRWWFVRDVPPAGDVDFRVELVAARANELADDFGNLVNRTITLIGRFRPDGLPTTERLPGGGRELQLALERVGGAVDDALARFDLRAGAEAVRDVAAAANRFVSAARPWELAKAERTGDAAAAAELDAALALLLAACRTIAVELRPFLPAAAARIDDALERLDPRLGSTIFPKVA